MISLVATILREDRGRVARAVGAAAASAARCARFEVVIAAPVADHPAIRSAAVDAGVDVVLIDNPTGRRSPGLKLADAEATGDVVVRFDARSLLPAEYVERCVERLRNPRIGVVGGHQMPCASGGRRGRGIARGLRNPWLLGGAAYRRPGRSGPVDTVYLGVFRRAELIELGGWDERLDANEDFDLCRRYAKTGLLVHLEARLDVPYEPRASVTDVARQYHAFGRSKVVFWRRTGSRPNHRQGVALALAPLMFATAVQRVRKGRGSALAAAAIAALFAADHFAEPRERDPVVRCYSMAAEIVAVTAWFAGVCHEVIRPAERVG